MKFFQEYIISMADIGGSNLPKAISSKLGSKLGKFYKEKGTSLDIEIVLKQMYAALRGKTSIKKLNDISYEVNIKYSKKFCPIGGIYNPSRGSVFQENICIPYMRGFLSEIFPQITTDANFLNCIPLDNQRTCHYILNMREKKK